MDNRRKKRCFFSLFHLPAQTKSSWPNLRLSLPGPRVGPINHSALHGDRIVLRPAPGAVTEKSAFGGLRLGPFVQAAP